MTFANVARRCGGCCDWSGPIWVTIFRARTRFFATCRESCPLSATPRRCWKRSTGLLNHYHTDVQPRDVELIHADLVSARDSVAGGEEQLVAKLESMVVPLEDAMERASNWEIGEDGFDAIEAGLMKTYRRARRAMALAYEHPSTANFHEWRKRVKYHWHHSLLLRRICPKLMKPHRRQAELLGELLGQDHDYAVLRERLTDLQDGPEMDRQKQVLISLIDRRQTELRVEMSHLGRYLQAEKPRQLAARWRIYWDTWHDEAVT